MLSGEALELLSNPHTHIRQHIHSQTNFLTVAPYINITEILSLGALHLSFFLSIKCEYKNQSFYSIISNFFLPRSVTPRACSIGPKSTTEEMRQLFLAHMYCENRNSCF